MVKSGMNGIGENFQIRRIILDNWLSSHRFPIIRDLLQLPVIAFILYINLVYSNFHQCRSGIIDETQGKINSYVKRR